MDLQPYTDTWHDDDPHANFKSEVAEYTRQDPLPTFEALGELTGIPVESLVRYALVKWASEGHEMIMHAGPRTVRRMWAFCEQADAADTDAARLEAYEGLRQMVSWLHAPLVDGETSQDRTA